MTVNTMKPDAFRREGYALLSSLNDYAYEWAVFHAAEASSPKCEDVKAQLLDEIEELTADRSDYYLPSEQEEVAEALELDWVRECLNKPAFIWALTVEANKALMGEETYR